MTDDEKRPTWHPGHHITLGSGGWLARVRWTIDAFENKLGLPVTPSSRLRNAEKLLTSLQTGAVVLSPEDDDLAQRIIDAQNTVWQFFVIANAIGRKPDRTSTLFTPDKLALAFSGADLERDDVNQLPRNTQFELYVAAVLVLGGAAVHGGEPDIRVSYWGQMVGVACKRVSSTNPQKIDRHAKDASRQIGAHAAMGFLAINVDVLFRDAPLPLDEDARVSMFSERVQATISAMDKRVSAAKHVQAVIVCGSISEWRYDAVGPHLEVAYPMSFIIIADDDQPSEAAKADEYFRGLVARWQNALGRLA